MPLIIYILELGCNNLNMKDISCGQLIDGQPGYGHIFHVLGCLKVNGTPTLGERD